MSASPLPSPDAVRAAAARITGLVQRTPLARSAALSALAGGDVYLKREDTQITGSFKARGAFNAVAQLSAEDRARGVVASSAGNHGLGVAQAARHFGVPATIYVPADAPQVKKRGIATLGALVDDGEADYDLAMVAAKRHAAEHGQLYINPCLGDALLAGQGTVALEILDELPDVGTVVVCVGGGGLLGGVGGYLRGAAPGVRIVGAQSERTAAMSRSLAAGRVVEIESLPTLADGLAGQIDDTALAIGQAALDDIVTLTEDEIAQAIAWLARQEGVTAEGAGVVAVAALLHGKTRSLPTPIVAIVSGGNIDADRLAGIMERCPADA
jgi:threonine dehydratase